MFTKVWWILTFVLLTLSTSLSVQAVLKNTLLSLHLVWPWWRPWQWQYEGVTNFLNILPQPMMIARRAWWIATTKLSSNGISLMIKHDISRFSSISTTAICKIACFPASKRTRTSLVLKKDRKGNRLNQHWSFCEASQQGENYAFSLVGLLQSFLHIIHTSDADSAVYITECH